AMSWKHLGKTFDIHGGGIDLVFPHHENEIAQSRCAFHTPVMAEYLMHNGFLQVEGGKMRKSLGDFVTIRELVRGWRGRAWAGSTIRWAMLQKNYREPLDWTVDVLRRSADELQGVVNLLRGHFRDPATSFVDIEGMVEAVKPTIPSTELLDALC